ncbi:esterase/lipase superfamily enzyme [Neorhizobium galegae]|uniref:alpha/beta hydrolase n=1 Tax=Neorhizobium galegae TaxID=399 RepID=UPI001AE60417|nr:alpha/beta fold hydrolase [Neorhizobium galegae]MBP2551745.1 esterase/lipase superfamily enzyme [Neorhizobium galegae]
MSMSMIGRLAVCLSMVAMLSACVTRPGPEVLDVPKISTRVTGTRQVTVYVATMRARPDPDRNVFTNETADKLNYAAFTISIPPVHRPGEIEWPKEGTPDPAASFVTIQQKVLDPASFHKAISLAQTGSRSQVGVFVHGFNTSFQEALFRLAQINADSDDGSRTPILFSWPSEASVTGYLADKDAATASRDGLSQLLDDLGRNPAVRKVTLIGHSMGGWLSAEALRQLRLSQKSAIFTKLTVFLAAPDIDVQVFRSQLAVIGSLSPPMTVLVSKDDRALAVSRLLAGQRRRIGALDVSDPRVKQAADLGKLEIIDISALSTKDQFNHNRFAQVSALAPILAPVEADSSGVKRSPGTFVLDTLSATLTSPLLLLPKAGQPGP